MNHIGYLLRSTLYDDHGGTAELLSYHPKFGDAMNHLSLMKRGRDIQLIPVYSKPEEVIDYEDIK